MAHPEQYPITRVPAFLIEQGFQTVSYWRVRDAAMSRKIPATQQANGRWLVDVSDPEALADGLKVERKAAA